MTVRNSFPTDLPDGIEISDTRHLFAGLITSDNTGNPRPGVLWGTGDPLVTGTPTMRYEVAGFHAVTSHTPGGIELVVNDGTTFVETDPAPSFNSRIDVVWVRTRFTHAGDDSSVPEIGVTIGEAGLNPVPKPLPAQAVELARIRIPSGVTGTNSANVVFTQTTQYTALAGTPVPFRTLTALQQWKDARVGQHATHHGTGEYVWDGSRWSPLRPVLQHAEFTATLGHFDLQWGYPQFTVDATNTTGDQFVTPWLGGHTNPSGLTFTSPGVYAVNFIASHTAGMTGRSMLSIEDPQAGAIIGRQNAQTGEDRWSLPVPNLYTTTANKRVSFGSYKHNGSTVPAAFRVTIDRLF